MSKVRTLIQIPDSMGEVYAMMGDMRGTGADLARVAMMSHAIGHREGAADALQKFMDGNSAVKLAEDGLTKGGEG